MSDSERQYKRRAQVVVGRKGVGLEIENLRIQFECMKTLDPEPNSCVIKIFNLHPDNEAKIKNEFDEVLLNAGYQDSMRLIFRGNIKHVYRYRDGNDYITEIEAGDGDKDFRTAIMNETLAAGTSPGQLVDRAVSSFTGGTTKGHVQLGSSQRLRGKVVSGNTRTVLSKLAKEHGANWSIQDGQLTIVSANDVMPGQAVLIRADTGMLGAPEINDKGIAVKCLLNPKIRVNGAIQLDNNGIKSKRDKAKALAKAEEKNKAPVRLDPDGIYKVIKLTHKGDTRGADFVSEIECIGLNQPIPKTRTANGSGSGEVEAE